MYSGPIPVPADTLWKYVGEPGLDKVYKEAYCELYGPKAQPPAYDYYLADQDTLETLVYNLFTAGEMTQLEYLYCDSAIQALNSISKFDDFTTYFSALSYRMDQQGFDSDTSLCISFFGVIESSADFYANGAGPLTQQAIYDGQGTVPTNIDWGRLIRADSKGGARGGVIGAVVCSAKDIVSQVF